MRSASSNHADAGLTASRIAGVPGVAVILLDANVVLLIVVVYRCESRRRSRRRCVLGVLHASRCLRELETEDLLDTVMLCGSRYSRCRVGAR
jgi:hypothetical protein